MLTERELGCIHNELQRWSGLHRSTARADREAAERAVHDLYHACGLPSPTQVVWSDSPSAMARAWYMSALDSDRSMRPKIVDDVRQSIDREIIEAAQAPVRFQLINAVRSSRQPFSRFVADLGYRAGAKACPRRQWLLARLARPLRGGRPTFANAAHCFKTDESIAVYSALLKMTELDGMRPQLSSYLELAEQVEWILPYGKTCWLAERPTILRIDASGRSHAAHSPAIGYANDEKIYAWKGVEIPERAILDPQSISIYEVARTRDPVVRRCLIDLMTPERFVTLRGATCIARDEYGKLWRRSWRLDAWAAVEVTNGTPEPDGTFKTYFLQVPAHFQTPRQAVAWTYGLLPEQYSLRQRT